MPGVYTYPPDQSLLREKLSKLPKTDTQEAWTQFERYWQEQKPVEQKVKRSFAFVGIPYVFLLRGFFALVLVSLSLLLYNTVNAKLPAVLHAPKARILNSPDVLRPIPLPQKQALPAKKNHRAEVILSIPKPASGPVKPAEGRSNPARQKP